MRLSALLTILFGLWASVTSVAQEQKNCVVFTLKVSLNAGQNYEQQIGGNLSLKLRADSSNQESNGWDFMIVDDRSGNDYIAPVNPPLRFNPSQMLGPGYGLRPASLSR